jgi:UDP-glucose 4-epimerase
MSSQPRHVLVTGGAGFVGSHLCDRLVADGVRVSVLDNLSRGKREWVPEGVTIYQVDVRDGAGVAAVFADSRPDTIAHLAALHFIPAVDNAPDLAEAINVGGTRNVLDAARAHPPERLLFASTAAVYANLSEPLSEELAPAPIDLYGRTKLAGEHLVAAFAADTGTRCILARLFNVMGPRETNPHILPEIVEQVRGGALELELGNLDPERDFVDARDVADALLALLRNAEPGAVPYNVGTGRAVSVADIVRTCGEILGREIPVRQVQGRMRAIERAVLVADVTRISAAVGWEAQRSFRNTLAELLA